MRRVSKHALLSLALGGAQLIQQWPHLAKPAAASLGAHLGHRRSCLLLRLSMVARTSAACLNNTIRDRWGGTRHVYLDGSVSHVARWRITEGIVIAQPAIKIMAAAIATNSVAISRGRSFQFAGPRNVEPQTHFNQLLKRSHLSSASVLEHLPWFAGSGRKHATQRR